MDVFITGCQRSGTTLLSLVLDSHPLITSVDEDKFSIVTFESKKSTKKIFCYKLPTYSADIDFFIKNKDIMVLWVERNPFDVVLSMTNLKFKSVCNGEISWANRFSLVEIARNLNNIPTVLSRSLRPLVLHYYHLLGLLYEERTFEDSIFLSSLCWRLKSMTPKLYDKYQIHYQSINYEQFVTTPKIVLNSILEFIELDWHDNLLNHHELHNGVSIGNTENTRAIDTYSISKNKKKFTKECCYIINDICNSVGNNLSIKSQYVKKLYK